MTKDYYQTFNFKVIYIFSIPHASHKGRLKIGDTVFEGNPYDKEAMKAAVKQRIDQYTKTADIEYNLLHFDLAVTNKGKAFRDYDVHSVLKRSGIKQTSTTKGREWFEVDLDTAIAAIEAVKKGESSLGQIKATSHMEQIIFRPEQEKAIVETLASIDKGKTKKLWNAKMRFGKTVSALELVKRAGFKKTIIITHRPVVSAGWFEDFHKIFNNDYRFGSNHKGESFTNLINGANPFVYFASMQDLRGSSKIGGNFNKNDLIFDTKWDCVIIDEAHEGNKTELAQSVHKHLERSFTLELSGTPFNLFEDYEDEADIYTWDYVMEQQAKYEWDQNNFGDSNPYASLPKLSIFTYHLDKEFINHQYVDIEDKAFNFREFFRTYDNNEPDFSLRGKFVHEKDVWDFLNLISKKDRYEEHQTNFPFSTDHYRDNLRNTLWLVPGVQEARALSELMKEHDVFSQFDIINVAGSGDNDSENIEALEKVKKAIGDDPENAYTITITCGKLTTGVSVPAWTGVMMLSNTTSPSTYLQTAFRVQTPANIGGQIKTECYVFDFAPDRTLKMVAQAAQLNTKAGSLNSPDQKAAMATFLNYCSVISNDNSKMNAIDVEHMLRQLKRAAVDKVVSTGFDDTNLYTDELLRLNEADIQDFNDLKAIIGTSKQEKKPLDVTINNQGFDDEEWQKALDAEKKKPKQRTPEEQEAIDKLNELKKQKKTMISILRGISIRIPMMIFGANIDADKEITLRNFVNLVDEKSWNEFMPPGVTKELFKKFSKYYDAEVFVEAGLKIRRKAKAADKSSSVKERVMKIADIFATFKNPDKETVLTPWKVVNRHLIETLGGESFFDEKFEYALHDGENTRLYAKPNITKNSLMNSDSKVLEINSKSGLYPLLACYNIYRQRVNEFRAHVSNEVLSREKHFELWEQTLQENIFVIAKTPMAKTISERTLKGYNDYYTNVVYYEDIMNDVKNHREEISNKIQTLFNYKGGENLKFDVVIGNPPYQEMDGGAQASASPIYHNFVRAAKVMNPKYISMIMPSRWYVGGKGLDDFREEMLNDPHIRELHDWLTPEDIFPNTNIRGGVSYFLWDHSYDNLKYDTRVVTHENNKVISDLYRPLKFQDSDIFIRDSKAISILNKINSSVENNLMDYISARNPFGFSTNFTKNPKFKSQPNELNSPIKCYANKGIIGYIEENEISKNIDWIQKYKVLTPYSNNIGTELNDDNLNTVIADKNSICTETYLVIGADLNLDRISAENLSQYLKSKFVRYLHSLAKSSQHGTRTTYRFVPLQNFTKESEINWALPINSIDQQLYAKYNLSDAEIEYIEGKIKEMK
ncbi:Eco57I restriction-modification methylase domain-containing protein (plasmid) [Lysinibacillus capsici]|uniref:Eco57I restriction-modification methylase domain-containing protein n=1 Tax=Lysinibacillus capsici TaxID=2115968 RepID=UPI0021D7F599|nr:Eco57I restriction-modification methylase domain-containing protein [Lysinibacillus capsici]UYB50121.1 Eco57I restriction-modification methylase domain-containing protein [Lysinibacillus capsici]